MKTKKIEFEVANYNLYCLRKWLFEKTFLGMHKRYTKEYFLKMISHYKGIVEKINLEL